MSERKTKTDRPDIEALREALEGIPEPPWVAWSGEGPYRPPSAQAQTVSVCRHVGDTVTGEHACVLHTVGKDEAEAARVAVFVALVRNGLPGLLAYVRQLEARIEHAAISLGYPEELGVVSPQGPSVTMDLGPPEDPEDAAERAKGDAREALATITTLPDAWRSIAWHGLVKRALEVLFQMENAEAREHLPLAGLRRYLEEHGWRCQREFCDEEADAYTSDVRDDEGSLIMLHLPSREDLRDAKRMKDAVVGALAALEGRTTDLILDEITGRRGDGP